MQYSCFFLPVGDFYQPPPVPNDLIGDSGAYCFESKIWDQVFPHTMQLAEVTRQSTAEDVALIKVIDECSRGCPSKATSEFLTSLDRPQYATDSVHLYNENADVNVHNQEVIKQMPGLLKVYTATNEYGEKKYLHKISAPQKLHLKVDCRVMCLINKGEL